MSLKFDLCGHLRFFEILLENKHMSNTNDDTNMTGNADNCDALRTKSGQKFCDCVSPRTLWAARGFCYRCELKTPPIEPAAPDLTYPLECQIEKQHELIDKLERQLAEARKQKAELVRQLVEVTRQRDQEKARASKCIDFRLAALSAEDALEKMTAKHEALVEAGELLEKATMNLKCSKSSDEWQAYTAASIEFHKALAAVKGGTE